MIITAILGRTFPIYKGDSRLTLHNWAGFSGISAYFVQEHLSSHFCVALNIHQGALRTFLYHTELHPAFSAAKPQGRESLGLTTASAFVFFEGGSQMASIWTTKKYEVHHQASHVQCSNKLLQALSKVHCNSLSIFFIFCSLLEQLQLSFKALGF